MRWAGGKRVLAGSGDVQGYFKDGRVVVFPYAKEDPMARQLISSGSSFEEEIGYSRAVVDGDWIFVSGTTGFDYATMTIAEGIEEQAEQCLRNISAALEQAGSGLKDIVRVIYVVPHGPDFPAIFPVLRKHLGQVRPAAMMISAGLSDPRMRIEIQATARRGSGA
jgi:enamine deaminase RidA (YjgF/YER057c/UK114 family)